MSCLLSTGQLQSVPVLPTLSCWKLCACVGRVVWVQALVTSSTSEGPQPRAVPTADTFLASQLFLYTHGLRCPHGLLISPLFCAWFSRAVMNTIMLMF
jgi:hypothetical protein